MSRIVWFIQDTKWNPKILSFSKIHDFLGIRFCTISDFFFFFLCTRQFFNSKKGDLDYFPRTNLFKANASIEIKLGGNVHRIIIYSLYIFFVGNPSQKKKRPNEIKHGVSICIGRKSITEKKRPNEIKNGVSIYMSIDKLLFLIIFF